MSKAKSNTQRAKKHQVQFQGKAVGVTVPQDETPEIFGAIRDELSPQAVAAIVAYLQPVSTKDKGVNKEVMWFADKLTELLGGYHEQGRLAEEVGL